MNHVLCKLTGLQVHLDIPAAGYGTVILMIVANPTLSGAATYADVRSDSVMQVDHTPGTGASVTYTSDGTVILSRFLEYIGANKGSSTSDASLNAEDFGLVAFPGDVFAIIVKDRAGSTVTCRLSLNWKELR